ncbi:MAG: carboxypeptidase-like regulatory domain-containing protein [Roseivirga sp.]|nr:carboxypeptidase-like regulatory domain-containing protein [Roseivirga sp.]
MTRKEAMVVFKTKHTLAIFLVLILSTLFNCKKPLVCGFGVYDYSCDSISSVGSEVISFHNETRSDTTLAHFNSVILGQAGINIDSSEYESVFGASVFIQSIGIDSLGFENVSDFEGIANFYAQPGEYDLHISFIGYNTLVIQNLSLESGMAVDLRVALGDGCGQNIFTVTDDNQIKKVFPGQDDK